MLFAAFFGTSAFAQYGTPESLKAELRGADLSYAKEAKAEVGPVNSLANGLFAPAIKPGEKLPALIVFHTCSGVREHIRTWAAEALKEGYVVLVPDAMRGIKHDCGSPSQIPNARMIKDILDGVAHLAALPYVDVKRISLAGYSKGALLANWLATNAVAEALRPGTPPLAALVSVYGFCGFGPTRARPQGVTILQSTVDRPLLLLMGALDTETPPSSCLERLPALKAAGAPVEWHVYPDATHGWDDVEMDGFTKTAWNGQRVIYRHDKAITEDSRRRIFEFLRDKSVK